MGIFVLTALLAASRNEAMELTRYNSIQDFYTQAAPFLLQREAEHNLILGLCHVLTRNPERIQQPPYLATVQHDGRIIADAFMAPPNNMIISHTTSAGAIPLIAADAHTTYKTLPSVVSSTPFSEQFAQEWQRIASQPYHLGMAQRIFQLEWVRPVTGVPGHLRPATEEDRPLLRRWLADFNQEALGETDTSRLEPLIDRLLRYDTQGIYIWDDGQPVSIAGFTRPTPNGICIAAVYTPPALRGKGFASACTAALSQLLLDQGRKFCCLYTDLANPTSNHIYQAIGYQPVCDSAMYNFADPIIQN
jgi:predicted GNAT family acetyltransferase